MPRTIAVILVVFAVVAVLPAQQRVTGDPKKVRFVTDDLASFARVLPGVLAAADVTARAALLQTEYIDRGSPGLREFARQGRVDAARLATALEQTPEYYRWIADEFPQRLSVLFPQLRESLAAFERLYPRARFPDIYFLVGQFRSSGTVADVGMLLGAEAFAVDQDTPVHEFTTARRGVAQPLRPVALQHRA